MKSSTRSRPCTANLAAALALSAANALAYIDTAEKAVVRTGEIMTIEIAADNTWDKPVFVDGVLRKTGSGKLTIAAEKLYGHGRIEVADGELAVTATGAGSDAVATPSAILAGAAMWLDASQHVEGTCGSASKWFDVREENWGAPGFTTNFIYAEAMAELATGGLLPSCGTDEAGRSYIYFGGFGSGQYMLWRTPDGAKAWIPVFQSFVAYNPSGSHGNYLGSATSASEDNSKQQYFATTTSVQPGTYFAQECNSIYNHLRNGRVFRNGERVSVSDPIDRAALQILETESYPEGKDAEAFFNYRNYQASSPNGVSGGGNRVGGGRLHEVLVFTNKLDETDRVVVGHWLLRKWVNQSGYGALPGFSVAQGATLSLPGQIASATAVASDGVVRINGGVADLGTANVADAFAGIDGIVELSGGAIVTNRADAAFAAEAGKSYAVDAWNAVAVSAGTSGEVRKTGAGTLALAGLDSATSIALDGGTASIRPPFSAGSAVAISPNVVADGGFEGIITDKAKNYGSGNMGAWTVAKISGDSSSLAVLSGPNHTTYGSQGAAEGSYRLVLKKGASVTQNVSLDIPGRYEIALRVTERPTYRGFERIYIDDILVGTAQTTDATVWDEARFETPWLSAGSHALKIVCETDIDVAAIIDDVQMRWLDSVRAVAVENGNFEDADWAMGGTYSAINSAIANSNVLSSAYITKWSAAGGAELLRALPYLRSNSKFEAPVTGTGSMSAFLPKGASLTQTVTIPENGLYRLSALLGRYVKSGQNNQTEASVRLTLGSSTETLSVANASVKRVGMSNAVRLSAGDTVTVSVASENVGDYNNVVVDDVLLERLDNLVANPGFEGGGSNNQSPAGWTVAANPENKQIIYDGSGNNEASNFGTSVAEGKCRARLHAGTRLEQTIPLAAGLYRLSFWNVSRVVQSRVYYGPSPILVTLAKGGVTNFCATATPSSSAIGMMRREFLVRIGEAGNWTLGFFATADTAQDLSSFIDAVRLVPADGLAANTVPDAGNEAMFAVAAGATLGLDWPGVVNAARVRVAGRSLPEGVATAASAPESLYGIGAFNILPRATTVILR